MNGKTHLIGGAAAAAIYMTAVTAGDFGAPELTIAQAVVSVPLCLAGSILPDIDLRTSTVGKNVKVISSLINALFGHRTFFHSPLFLLVLYLGTKAHLPMALWIVIPIIVGAASHLVLDMLNRSGIPLFWPIQTRFWLFGVKTNSFAEKVFQIILLSLAGALWIKFGLSAIEVF